MKYFILLYTAMILSLATFAQAPNGINYQTVIRDGDGNILPYTELSLQMTICSGTPDGEIVYQETHDVSTNSFGLVDLIIGNGTLQTGDFAAITWGNNSHYLQTAIDADGSGNFVLLGSTQFLSAPYALHANTADILSMNTDERDSLINPRIGTRIFNTDTECIDYFTGSVWLELCGSCSPQPSQAFAGEDQIFIDGTSTQLDGNEPLLGDGTWSILSGAGGGFSNPNDPKATFNGELHTNYILEWRIETQCGWTSDEVNISLGKELEIILGVSDILEIDSATISQNFADTLAVFINENPANSIDAYWKLILGNTYGYHYALVPNSWPEYPVYGFWSQLCMWMEMAECVPGPAQTCWQITEGFFYDGNEYTLYLYGVWFGSMVPSESLNMKIGTGPYDNIEYKK